MSCLASILHTDKKTWSIEEEDISKDGLEETCVSAP